MNWEKDSHNENCTHEAQNNDLTDVFNIACGTLQLHARDACIEHCRRTFLQLKKFKERDVVLKMQLQI